MEWIFTMGILLVALFQGLMWRRLKSRLDDIEEELELVQDRVDGLKEWFDEIPLQHPVAVAAKIVQQDRRLKKLEG